MEEITLTPTVVETDALFVIFSWNNKHVFIWEKRNDGEVLVVKKREVRGFGLAGEYTLPGAGAFENIFSAPGTDCFAVQFTDCAHVFVPNENMSIIVRTEDVSHAAFSWDDVDSGQLLYAIVKVETGQLWIHHIQARSRLMIHRLPAPVFCAFSPDGASLVVICGKDLIVLSMDHMFSDRKEGVNGSSIFGSAHFAPAVRVVDMLSPGETGLMRISPTAAPRSLSFSADSAHIVVRHAHVGVTVWRMSDLSKIAHLDMYAAQVAFMDKKGRFVSMVGHDPMPLYQGKVPTVIVWDTQINDVGRASFGAQRAHPYGVLSHTGDLLFTVDWPRNSDADGTAHTPRRPPTFTTINYRPAKIADDDDFDPEIAFEGIKNAASGARPRNPQ